MEYKKTVNSSKLAFLSVPRIDRNFHGNLAVPVSFWKFLVQTVPGIFQHLLNHFVTSHHGRMITPVCFCTGEPVYPINLASPRLFQAVTKKDSHCVDYLLKLRFISLLIQVSKDSMVCFLSRVLGWQSTKSAICCRYQAIFRSWI